MNIKHTIFLLSSLCVIIACTIIFNKYYKEAPSTSHLLSYRETELGYLFVEKNGVDILKIPRDMFDIFYVRKNEAMFTMPVYWDGEKISKYSRDGSAAIRIIVNVDKGIIEAEDYNVGEKIDLKEMETKIGGVKRLVGRFNTYYFIDKGEAAGVFPVVRCSTLTEDETNYKEVNCTSRKSIGKYARALIMFDQELVSSWNEFYPEIKAVLDGFEVKN